MVATWGLRFLEIFRLDSSGFMWVCHCTLADLAQHEPARGQGRLHQETVDLGEDRFPEDWTFGLDYLVTWFSSESLLLRSELFKNVTRTFRFGWMLRQTHRKVLV